MPAMRQPNIAAIEAGGTTFVVAVGRDIANSIRHSIPTTSPIETLSRVARIINDGLSGDPLNAMGVASFGPLCIDSADPHYGVIGATPKSGWQGFNLKTHLQTLLGCPIAFDTDVNSAACAEAPGGRGPLPGGRSTAPMSRGGRHPRNTLICLLRLRR